MLKTFFTFSLLLFSLVSVQAQITIDSERDSDGNVILTAMNPDPIPYTVLFSFSKLENLSTIGGGDVIGIANPGTSKIATLKRKNSSQGTNYSYSYSYVRGNIYAKSKISPVYLIPLKEEVTVRASPMTHLSNRLQPKEMNDDYVGIAFHFEGPTEILAPRKGYVTEIKMDNFKQSENLAFSSEENYIELYHADGSTTQIKVLKAGTERVKLGQVVFPGDVLAESGGENYENGPHVRLITKRVEKAGEGKLKNVIFPVQFWTVDGPAELAEVKEIRIEHPQEIIVKEMKKKELKAYQAKK